MLIRLITIADHPKLITFWKTNYFVNELDEYIRFKHFLEKNPKLSLLAEDKGKIIGTVLGSFDGRRGYIQKLVVGKNYRKQGLGKQLMESVVGKLKKLGVLYIPISCEAENTAFYQKSGFKKTGQITLSKSWSHYKKP